MTIGTFMKRTDYSIKAGEFKAKCLHLMDEVNAKHISFIITKHGKPIAKLTPIDTTPISSFGCLKNTVSIQGDIIAPIDEQWDAEE